MRKYRLRGAAACGLLLVLLAARAWTDTPVLPPPMRPAPALYAPPLSTMESIRSIGRPPLTVAAALETRRLMRNPQLPAEMNPDGAISLSPDGRHYVVRVVQGDVARNGAWMELMVGELGSLATAARLRTVVRLFTSGLGPGLTAYLGAHQDTSEVASPLRWLDNEHVAFLWSDQRETRQVVSVNIATRQIRWLTQHPTSVAGFDVRGEVMVYNAQRRRPAVADDVQQAGFVVPERADAYSVLLNDFSGESVLDRRMNTEWFVREGTQAPARQLHVTQRRFDLDVRHRIQIAPQGRQVLIDATPDQIPSAWDRYGDPDLARWIAEAQRDRHALSARNVHQWVVADVQRGTTRPLWNAPSVATVTRAAWSPDGRFVVLAPTPLPMEAGQTAADAGQAAAVIDVGSGHVVVLPVTLPSLQALHELRWRSANEIELGQRDGAQVRWRQYRFEAGHWRAIDAVPAPVSVAPLRFELQQDLVTPPRLVVIETATQRQATALDLNPDLTCEFDLARVERVAGELSGGARWEGLLFYPIHFVPGRRYPLVIQSTYGVSISDEFTLYGHQGSVGLGPAVIAPYPGQMLAARDIAVLHLAVHLGSAFNTPAEAPTYQQAFEDVTAHFVGTGLADRQRVGLLGFSRNGYYVEYTLTHSAFPFAAAITADNWDPSYFQQTLLNDVAATAAVNGAEPFGEGLKLWLQRAPGFNVEKIHTPLRMVELSHGGAPGVLSKWELFARLRHLKKPVEFYVMPRATRGTHNPQNPAQILGVQQGSVDWFDFWLNDREDPAPSKVLQYERWRRLRQLQSSSIEVER